MDQTQDNIVPDNAGAGEVDLTDQIESLLGDIESTQHAIAQAVGDSQPETTPAMTQPLGDEGAARPEPRAEQPGPVEGATTGEAAAQSAIDQAQQSLGELSSAVDELLAPDVPKPVEPAPASTGAVPAPINADNIQSLDEELAKLTDELLADPNASVPARPAEAAPEPVPEPVVKPDAKPPPEPVAPAPVPSPSQASEPPRPAPEEKPQPPVRVEPKPPAASKEPSAPRKGVWESLSPRLLRVASLASLPLQGKPEALRGALGAMAAGTALMGAALWIIVLTRSQPLDEQSTGSFDFAHASLPEIPRPEEKSDHAKSDGHAKDAHADPHAETGKDAHGEAKKDEHASEAHGEAKKGDSHAEKKPPPKKTSRSKPTAKKGKDAKPPPKKDDGHGGEHGGGH